MMHKQLENHAVKKPGQILAPLVCGLALALSGTWVQSAPAIEHSQLVAQARSACASYQGRKLSLVVPFKPGGGFDLMARALEPFLVQYSGMQVGVSNVTGGSGLLAIRSVVNAKADKPVVGLLDLGSFATQMMEAQQGPALAVLSGLGVMSTDYSVWVAKKAISWQEKNIGKLLGASSANPFLRLGLPGHAMALKTQPVLGYQGTNDTWLAMLRGEVDVATMSDQSALRNLASGADARVSLTLTEKSHPDFPGVPYLAGTSGIVDVRTKDMDPVERKRLMALGDLAAMLSEQARILVASAKLKPEVLACLRHATEAALFDPGLAEVAKRQKFGLNPENAQSAQVKMHRVGQALNDNRVHLQAIAAAWKEGN